MPDKGAPKGGIGSNQYKTRARQDVPLSAPALSGLYDLIRGMGAIEDKRLRDTVVPELLMHENASPRDITEHLCSLSHPLVQDLGLLDHQNLTDAHRLEIMQRCTDATLLGCVIGSANTPDGLRAIWEDRKKATLAPSELAAESLNIARNPITPIDVLEDICASYRTKNNLRAAAVNPNASPQIMIAAAKADRRNSVTADIMLNPAMTTETLSKLMNIYLERAPLIGGKADTRNPFYLRRISEARYHWERGLSRVASMSPCLNLPILRKMLARAQNAVTVAEHAVDNPECPPEILTEAAIDARGLFAPDNLPSATWVLEKALPSAAVRHRNCPEHIRAVHALGNSEY